MPKFVEDAEKDEEKGEEVVDTDTQHLESIAETEYDIEPDNMSESHRDRAPSVKEPLLWTRGPHDVLRSFTLLIQTAVQHGI